MFWFPELIYKNEESFYLGIYKIYCVLDYLMVFERMQ
jgi:hypothetical protein